MAKKKQYVRLRDPGTVFSDPESDFVISGDQRKPLPKRQGAALKARIRTGVLISADRPPAAKAETKAAPPAEKPPAAKAETKAAPPAEKPPAEEKPKGKAKK